ncbi:MAG: hypothetical protein RLZZ76_519 [Candidatus Parcubacteria bacterium]|jgi:transketolase
MRAEHLDTKIGTVDVQKVANRDGFGSGLKEAGEQNPQVVALCADLTESTRVNVFAEGFPERFIQVGIAEQNMASVASGMAALGKVPFIASYAMFSPGRSWEQVRTTIAYNDANVKIIGAHAGVSVGPDGATHQAIEDIALMRVIPNMVVIAPCDVHEAKKATLAASKYKGPVYIRIARDPSAVVTTEASPFEIGKAYTFFHKNSAHAKTVGIITTGILAHNAIVAAEQLHAEGIGVSVLHMPTIKPLDTQALDQFGAEHESIVTLEEHQVAGGLGGAVSEYYSEYAPKRVVKLGIHDQFGQSGTPDELLKHYGLDIDTIVKTVRGL